MGLRYLSYIGLLSCLLATTAAAQTAGLSNFPDAPQANTTSAPTAVPDDRQRLDLTSKERPSRIKKLAIVNYRPYEKPTAKDQFINYLIDSYGLPALGRSVVRAAYAQGRGKPEAWGQDFPGFMQRYGSALASNAVSGNVRYGMETVFHEDMRYIPCHGCTVKHKMENALLAEVTARHNDSGQRFFTLTPLVSDVSGPIIANSVWVPGGEPVNGLIALRTVIPVRIGAHLFTEFVLERRHHDKPED
jgi:hypothetical protein